ncbi:MAG: hypothetical protein DSY40_01685 [Nautilia sp.]|nr:MAG: hypothetical protein DSY40_01685 [Nautilia sp.]
MKYIGIFWIIDNSLLAKKIELSQIKPINGFKDSDFSHFFEWEKMGYDIDMYDKFPRGRVVYNIHTKKFIFYCAKEIIKNSSYQKMILNYFNIQNNYSFEYDEHYKLT